MLLSSAHPWKSMRIMIKFILDLDQPFPYFTAFQRQYMHSKTFLKLNLGITKTSLWGKTFTVSRIWSPRIETLNTCTKLYLPVTVLATGRFKCINKRVIVPTMRQS